MVRDASEGVAGADVESSYWGEIDTEQGFTELAIGAQQQMLRVAQAKLGNPDDAEDAVQEGLLRAWRGRGTFEHRRGANPKTWLQTIVMRESATLGKRRSRILNNEGVELEDERQVSLEPQLDSLAERVSGHLAVRQFVGSLKRSAVNEERTRILEMHFAGFSNTEIAQTLGKTVGSTKTQLSRAKSDVRRVLPEEIELLR